MSQSLMRLPWLGLCEPKMANYRMQFRVVQQYKIASTMRQQNLNPITEFPCYYTSMEAARQDVSLMIKGLTTILTTVAHMHQESINVLKRAKEFMQNHNHCHHGRRAQTKSIKKEFQLEMSNQYGSTNHVSQLREHNIKLMQQVQNQKNITEELKKKFEQQFSREKKAYQNRIQKYQKKIEKRNDRLQEYLQTQKRMYQEVCYARQCQEKSEKQRIQAREDSKNKKRQLKKCMKQAENKEADLQAQLRNQQTQYQQKIRKLHLEISSLKRLDEDNSDRLADAHRQMDTLNKSNNEEITKLYQHCKELERRRIEAREDVKKQRARNIEIQKQNQSLRERLMQAENNEPFFKSQKQKQQAKSQEQFTRFQQQNLQLKKLLNNAGEQIAETKRKLYVLKNQKDEVINQLHSRREESKESKKRLEKDEQYFREQLEKSKDRQKQCKSQCLNLNKRLSEAEQKIQSLLQQQDRKRQQIEQRNRRLHCQNLQFKQLFKLYEELNQSNLNKLRIAETQINQKQHLLQESNYELAKLNQKCQQLVIELRNFRSKQISYPQKIQLSNNLKQIFRTFQHQSPLLFLRLKDIIEITLEQIERVLPENTYYSIARVQAQEIESLLRRR